MNKKTLVNGMLLVLALLLVVGMAYQFTPAIGNLMGSGGSSSKSGTPALKVNGSTITVEELDAMKRGNPILSSTDGGVLEDDFKTYMVAQQVQQKLLVEAASDVKVSRDDVNAEITKIREANDLTDNQKYQDALQQAGISDAELREQVKQQLAVQRKVEALKAAVPAATEAEAKFYYDQNKELFQNDARIVGRWIVVKDAKKAAELLKQARGGADFAQLASANSEQNKDRGGALGPIENGKPKPVTAVTLPTEVANAAFALEQGGLTDVVTTGGKSYIVKVEEYLAPTTKPFAEARADAVKAVDEQKKNQATEEWFDKLRDGAKVEVVDPAWKTEDPVVATVAGKNILYSEIISQVVNNQQVAGLLQQVPAEQASGLVNGMLKPGLVTQTINAYATPVLVKRLNLAITGTRQEQVAALSAYGARNVQVTDADIEAYYQQNKAQFETAASATIAEASFKTQAAAEAFRSSWNGQGDFVQAASKAGGTVSERGEVTGGGETLSAELNAAAFDQPGRNVGAGTLSPVTKSGERFSVLYVTDLKPKTTEPLSAVRSEIRAQVLASKQAEAGQKFIDTQVATLKPVNNLQKILDAQAKRVAAAAPKKPAATEEKDGAAGTATPEGSTDAPAAEGGEAAPPAQE